MSNTQIPILVAPRPVRLSAPFFSPEKRAFNVPESLSRASSRSALSSEALDEFLSILTPSFVHKPRPQPSANLNIDSSRHSVSPKPDAQPPQLDTGVRWFSQVLLSSPVSRIHTRNPFPRHHRESPAPPAPPLTPAAIPLPSPTPDELNENI